MEAKPKLTTTGTTSPKLAALEKQAAELEAQITTLQNAGELSAKRRDLSIAIGTAESNLERRTVMAQQAAQENAAFSELSATSLRYRESASVSIERLEAGTADNLARLADIHDALKALDFFAATHAARSKTCAAKLKSAEAAKVAASAERKTLAAELEQIDRQITEAERIADADWNTSNAAA